MYKKVKKITIIKNWLGRRGHQFTDSLMQEEKQACETFEGLCNTFVETFVQHLMKQSKLPAIQETM